MKKYIIIAIFSLFTAANVHAQQFVENAVIEYEVKTNIKKTMGSSSWAEMMSESLPQFKTGYYKFSFADNKSMYKFDHWDEKMKLPDFWKKADEESSWYFNHTEGNYSMQKSVVGSLFNVQDSIRKIEWKLSNENRIIAGYNCRKAVGKILDSVYVFAFYTDEILIPGGPCSISGLPGMILGLTIPRMYTSWIALKVDINAAKPADIKPITGKKMLTTSAFGKDLQERTKDWGNADDPDSKKWMDQFLWSSLL